MNIQPDNTVIDCVQEEEKIIINIFTRPELLRLNWYKADSQLVFEVFLISLDYELYRVYKTVKDKSITEIRSALRERLGQLKNRLRKGLLEFSFNLNCDKQTLPIEIKTIISNKTHSVTRKIRIPIINKKKIKKPKKGEKEWTAYSVVSSI